MIKTTIVVWLILGLTHHGNAQELSVTFEANFIFTDKASCDGIYVIPPESLPFESCVEKTGNFESLTRVDADCLYGDSDGVDEQDYAVIVGTHLFTSRIDSYFASGDCGRILVGRIPVPAQYCKEIKDGNFLVSLKAPNNYAELETASFQDITQQSPIAQYAARIIERYGDLAKAIKKSYSDRTKSYKDLFPNLEMRVYLLPGKNPQRFLSVKMFYGFMQGENGYGAFLKINETKGGVSFTEVFPPAIDSGTYLPQKMITLGELKRVIFLRQAGDSWYELYNIATDIPERWELARQSATKTGC